MPEPMPIPAAMRAIARPTWCSSNLDSRSLLLHIIFSSLSFSAHAPLNTPPARHMAHRPLEKDWAVGVVSKPEHATPTFSLRKNPVFNRQLARLQLYAASILRGRVTSFRRATLELL